MEGNVPLYGLNRDFGNVGILIQNRSPRFFRRARRRQVRIRGRTNLRSKAPNHLDTKKQQSSTRSPLAGEKTWSFHLESRTPIEYFARCLPSLPPTGSTQMLGCLPSGLYWKRFPSRHENEIVTTDMVSSAWRAKTLICVWCKPLQMVLGRSLLFYPRRRLQRVVVQK